MPPSYSVVILTFGIGMIFRGAAGVIWTFDTLTIKPAFSMEPIKFWKLVITMLNIGNVAVSVILMLALFFFYKFTVLGTGIRAMAQNRLAAILMGIKVKRGQHGDLGDLLHGRRGRRNPFGAHYLCGHEYGRGGYQSLYRMHHRRLFGSFPGCIAGCILLGVIEAVIGYYLPTEVKQVLVFLVLIGFLCVRPSGLFGKVEIKKV